MSEKSALVWLQGNQGAAKVRLVGEFDLQVTETHIARFMVHTPPSQPDGPISVSEVLTRGRLLVLEAANGTLIFAEQAFSDPEKCLRWAEIKTLEKVLSIGGNKFCQAVAKQVALQQGMDLEAAWLAS